MTAHDLINRSGLPISLLVTMSVSVGALLEFSTVLRFVFGNGLFTTIKLVSAGFICSDSLLTSASANERSFNDWNQREKASRFIERKSRGGIPETSRFIEIRSNKPDIQSKIYETLYYFSHMTYLCFATTKLSYKDGSSRRTKENRLANQIQIIKLSKSKSATEIKQKIRLLNEKISHKKVEKKITNITKKKIIKAPNQPATVFLWEYFVKHQYTKTGLSITA